jgi:SAM-dependent methyltransferase
VTWPKTLPQLSDEQQRIREDFVRYWHEVLPRRYGVIERFNHDYPLRHGPKDGVTLEIGSGLGEHLRHENLDAQEYYALELRPELAARTQADFPSVKVIVGDCQETLPFPDRTFDRVLAVHVLEHLPNLPRALDEVRRVLSSEGRLAVVIPCEGGRAYSLARRISAQRLFERRYKMSYDWFIASEHVNRPHEIRKELDLRFRTVDTTWFPLRVPLVDANIAIGLTLTHR